MTVTTTTMIVISKHIAEVFIQVYRDNPKQLASNRYRYRLAVGYISQVLNPSIRDLDNDDSRGRIAGCTSISLLSYLGRVELNAEINYAILSILNSSNPAYCNQLDNLLGDNPALKLGAQSSCR